MVHTSNTLAPPILSQQPRHELHRLQPSSRRTHHPSRQETQDEPMDCPEYHSISIIHPPLSPNPKHINSQPTTQFPQKNKKKNKKTITSSPPHRSHIPTTGSADNTSRLAPISCHVMSKAMQSGTELRHSVRFPSAPRIDSSIARPSNERAGERKVRRGYMHSLPVRSLRLLSMYPSFMHLSPCIPPQSSSSNIHPSIIHRPFTHIHIHHPTPRQYNPHTNTTLCQSNPSCQHKPQPNTNNPPVQIRPRSHRCRMQFCSSTYCVSKSVVEGKSGMDEGVDEDVGVEIEVGVWVEVGVCE